MALYTEKYNIEPEILWELYWGLDYSAEKISHLFDCHKDTIIWKMKKFNIPRKDRYQNRTKINIEKELLLSLYYGNNYTTTKISDIFGYSSERILNLLKKYNIPIKDRSYYDAWNKGTKGIVSPNKTSFKKGDVPWNKGIDGSYISGENNYNYKGVRKLVICEECGIEFMRKTRTQKCCSIECANKNKDNGLTPKNEKIRASKKYSDWRKIIFKRDNYTCQMCGQIGGELNAHHIKSFAKYKTLRFDLDNGITLCKKCHYKLHTCGD